MENEYKTEKKCHNWDYSSACKKYLEEAQALNKSLREIQGSLPTDLNNLSKIIEALLLKEKSNFEYTLKLYMEKLKYFDLLKTDADAVDFEENTKNVYELKSKKAEIRNEINELISELKYSEN
jgi:hypothetical protein